MVLLALATLVAMEVRMQLQMNRNKQIMKLRRLDGIITVETQKKMNRVLSKNKIQ